MSSTVCLKTAMTEHHMFAGALPYLRSHFLVGCQSIPVPDCCKFATTHFDVWSTDEELTAVVHFSAELGLATSNTGRDQRSLNHDAAAIENVMSTKVITCDCWNKIVTVHFPSCSYVWQFQDLVNTQYFRIILCWTEL
jgi:hypothetical protein